jgi:hypothetical protein
MKNHTLSKHKKIRTLKKLLFRDLFLFMCRTLVFRGNTNTEAAKIIKRKVLYFKKGHKIKFGNVFMYIFTKMQLCFQKFYIQNSTPVLKPNIINYAFMQNVFLDVGKTF